MFNMYVLKKTQGRRIYYIYRRPTACERKAKRQKELGAGLELWYNRRRAQRRPIYCDKKEKKSSERDVNSEP